MKIVLASRNKHKIGELEALLGKHVPELEVLSLDDIGFEGDIVEDGETFEDNALIKASTVARLGYIGVGDDSGLSVKALNGAPGVYSARYAGEHGDNAANNELLLKNLADKEDRSAEFVCTIACAFPESLSNEDFVVRGECRGIVLHEEKGDGGFGYDPLFFVEEYEKTYAELSAEEKNKISHRAVATELFAKQFCKMLDNQEYQ